MSRLPVNRTIYTPGFGSKSCIFLFQIGNSITMGCRHSVNVPKCCVDLGGNFLKGGFHLFATFYGCVSESLYSPFCFVQCAIYLPVIRNYIELQGTAFYIHRIRLFICCKILSAFSLVILVALVSVLPSSSSAILGASINNRCTMAHATP